MRSVLLVFIVSTLLATPVSSTASSPTTSSNCSSSSSSQSSQYGRKLFGGLYSCDGTAIRDLQIINTGTSASGDMQIYENMVIINDKNYYQYQGDQVLFNINYRKYVGNQADVAIYVDGSGGVLFATSSTLYVPYVGNLTTITYSIFKPGALAPQQPLMGGGTSVPSQGNNASREQMYRSQYAQWEKTVISNWNTLTSMRDGAARTSMRMTFRSNQSQMRQVRQNAQMEGIYIPVSAWETASVPLGYE